MHDAIVVALVFNVATWATALMLLVGLSKVHRVAHALPAAPPTPSPGVSGVAVAAEPVAAR